MQQKPNNSEIIIFSSPTISIILKSTGFAIKEFHIYVLIVCVNVHVSMNMYEHCPGINFYMQILCNQHANKPLHIDHM